MKNKPSVLLLGNGINRAYDFASWDGLLLSLQNKPLGDEDKKVLDGVPYPLQAVIMSGDHVDEQMKNISMHLAELIPPEEEQKVLRQFAQLPIEAILTTNYTYEMEKSLSTDFSCKAGCKCKYRKSRNPDASKYEAEQLYTCFELSENTPSIWHIHGEAARPGTMIIGHYYYGKLIAKAQKYLAVHMASYKSFVYGKTDYMPNSWLDYFMLGDIYIIGLGMDLSEMDLWWLVNYKKRHFPHTKITLFKPDIKSAERMLAEAYQIEVSEDGLCENAYKDYYQWVYEQMEELLHAEQSKMITK